MYAPARAISAMRTRLGGVIRNRFHTFERLGLHVMRVDHFHDPIPDTRTLDYATFAHRSQMVGVDMRHDQQLSLLEDLARRYATEFDSIPSRADGTGTFHRNNASFETPDIEILYGLIRSTRPRRYVEIGSGYSTLLAAEAIARNNSDGAAPCEIVAIEPYPSAGLLARQNAITRLVRSRVQDVPLEEFTALRGGDILFIDSTHILSVGSDVWYEFLEILPRLAPGVLVHVHDVFLPSHYPQSWVVDQLRFWNEQYVLQAFMAFNSAFEVVWAGSYLHHTVPERLTVAFSHYSVESSMPGSFWIRRTG